MFAVIKTGGKQYRIAADDVITVAKLAGQPGETVTFGEVVLFSDGGETRVGAPALAGVTVAAEVVEQARGPKVVAFKKRRRKNSRRKRGHRQDLTVVRIADILVDGLARRASETAASEPSQGALPEVAAPTPAGEAGTAA